MIESGKLNLSFGFGIEVRTENVLSRRNVCFGSNSRAALVRIRNAIDVNLFGSHVLYVCSSPVGTGKEIGNDWYKNVYTFSALIAYRVAS